MAGGGEAALEETEKYIKPITLVVAMFVSSSAISNIKSELEKTTKAVEETGSLIEQGAYYRIKRLSCHGV